MQELSIKAQNLLKFLKDEYIVSGYMYSGSWPYNSLIDRGFGQEEILELQNAGLIQERDCEGYAFELSAIERGRLITLHSLCSVWYEKSGDALLPEIQKEMRDVADDFVEPPLVHDKGFVTIRTLKVMGDSDKPDKVEVPCAFSVGQVLNLEYDLPGKMGYSGYSHQSFIPGGKVVGRFIVTDVIHNLMVYPSMNIFEIQSLCEEFNKLYPRERSMMVFEDVLLKRVKDVDGNLEQKLQSAVERSARAENVGLRNVEIDTTR